MSCAEASLQLENNLEAAEFKPGVVAAILCALPL